MRAADCAALAVKAADLTKKSVDLLQADPKGAPSTREEQAAPSTKQEQARREQSGYDSKMVASVLHTTPTWSAPSPPRPQQPQPSRKMRPITPPRRRPRHPTDQPPLDAGLEVCKLEGEEAAVAAGSTDDPPIAAGSGTIVCLYAFVGKKADIDEVAADLRNIAPTILFVVCHDAPAAVKMKDALETEGVDTALSRGDGESRGDGGGDKGKGKQRANRTEFQAQFHVIRQDEIIIAGIAMLGVGWMHGHATSIDSMPIALVRKGTAIEAKATRTLEIGELVVPLFFSKQSSMHCQGEGGTVHPNAACVEVSWTTGISEEEAEAGMEDKTWEVRIPVHVQPELKLPDKTKDGLAWKQDSAVHPYWFIKRNDGNHVEANADVVRQDVTHLFACSFRPLASDAVALSPAADSYVVSVPCIVNTKKIAMGQEVILKGQQTSTKRPLIKTRPEVNAFEQITKREQKRKKSIHGGGEKTHGGGAA